MLLERLATLTERLTQLLDDQNQGEIAGILANTNQMTAALADAAPQFERTMAELQITLREASEALDEFETVTASTDRLLNQEGAALAADRPRGAAAPVAPRCGAPACVTASAAQRASPSCTRSGLFEY